LIFLGMFLEIFKSIKLSKVYHNTIEEVKILL